MVGILSSIAFVVLGYLIESLVDHYGPMVVEYLLSPMKSVIAYIYCYKDNVRGLEEEVEKMMHARERVQHMVDEARMNGEELESDVKKWLKNVSEVAEEASSFFNVEENAPKSFFYGFSPNFKSRYNLSKKAVDIMKIVCELQEGGKFDRVSYCATPKWKGIAPVDGYEDFESRMSTSKKIMASFKNESISMIGVYGMGGVGKTTLLKEVGRRALEDKLFDEAVMATVTQNPDLRKIQGEIAEKLGLRFEEETFAGRAAHLRERLKKEKKILVILDDLWAKLDLEAVGIPYGSDHKGCKILLASRSLDVLSIEMDTQKNFAVGVLTDQEAWDLFKKMAGDSVEDPGLQATAAEIVKECAGLPVAIVTVARALRNKSSFEWKNAARQLRRPASASRNIRKMQATIYSTLELSYRQLESEELKSTFLLCGMMNYNISVKDLLKYGMGLRLFHGVYTTEEAWDRVYTLVRNLKASCLLVDGNGSDCFRMHDVVRDAAQSIASRDHNAFIVRDDVGLVEWPAEETTKNCRAISLQNVNIEGLPDRLLCSELEFFYMACKDPSLKIPDKFFKGLDALKVLHMGNMHFPFLPSSFGSLENLRTLCLDNCVLGDTGLVGELKSLVILSFVGSDIEKLPTEVKQLTRLKMLDLSNCTKLKVIPPNVISSLFQLEELYMANSFIGWEANPFNTQRGNASLAELKNLPNLVSLDIHVPDAGALPKDLLFVSLTRYRILIGDVWDWSCKNETSRTLKLKLGKSIHLEDGIKILLKRTEDLYLDGLKGVRDILYDLDSEGFPQLKHLHVQNSSEIEYLVDSVEGIPCSAFPVLESLFLHNLIRLKKICNGQLTAKSFLNLQIVKVENCDRLKSLFSFSLVKGLVHLREIKINGCENMEQIVAEESDYNLENSDAIDNISFSHLRLLELERLPRLTNFYCKVKTDSSPQWRARLPMGDMSLEDLIQEIELDTPTALFNGKVAFPNLEVLKLSSIGCQKIWQDQPLASSSAHPQEILSFQNLTFLKMKGCHNIKYLLSSSTSQSLVKLKRFEVHKCNAIEDVFLTLAEERMETLSFPQLEFLSLKDLPNLTTFCWGNSAVFPSLTRLHIKHCPQLKEFIYNASSVDIEVSKEHVGMSMENNHCTAIQPLFSEKVAFPVLKVMKFSHLHSTKMLWNNQHSESFFCKLKALKIKHFKELLSLFPSGSIRRCCSLESLIVIDCHWLEEVFEVQDHHVEEMHVAETTKLRSLYLSNLPRLKHVWSKDPSWILTFKSLQSVSAFSCPSLKNLFPASVARGLLQLKQLEIGSCGLEEIVGMKKGQELVAKFLFPQMNYLLLQDLPELWSFYPGLHTLDWPLLKKLEVIGCPKVEKFTSDYQSFHEMQGAAQLKIPIQQHLFLVEKDAFLNLEELRLEENGMMKGIWHGEFLAEFIHKTSSRLRRLKLSKLPELRYLWEADSYPSLVFQHVESLYVSYCSLLQSLVPSSVSFEQLVTLEVSGCGGLLNLITPSTARSMVRLTRVSITDCKMLTEIVEHMVGDAEAEIVFNQLKCLELNCLPALSCFCSGSQAFSFPSLEKVLARQCPKMQSFCKGVLSAPKLERVHVMENDDEWCWEGDLNTTLQQLVMHLDDVSSSQPPNPRKRRKTTTYWDTQ